MRLFWIRLDGILDSGTSVRLNVIALKYQDHWYTLLACAKLIAGAGTCCLYIDMSIFTCQVKFYARILKISFTFGGFHQGRFSSMAMFSIRERVLNLEVVEPTQAA